MSLPEVHLAGGTCAQALRLAPVALALREQDRLAPVLLAAGAEPTLVSRTYIACGLASDVTLPSAAGLATAIRRYDQLWSARTPAAVVVCGDNLAAALAAYWRRVPVMHVDAGRRSGSLVADDADADRRLLAQVATVHLAAAPLAAMNLLDERVVPGDVLLTGGTAVEAARLMAARTRPPATPRDNRVLVVGMTPGTDRDEPVRAAVLELTARHHDLDVFGGLRMPHPERSRLIAAAEVVVTDDVELAEEALAAATPVLVPGLGGGLTEAVHAGSARLVDPEAGAIVAELESLLASRVRRDSPSDHPATTLNRTEGFLNAAGTPYGDGLAASRIAQATAAVLGHGQFPDPMPARPEAGVPR